MILIILLKTLVNTLQCLMKNIVNHFLENHFWRTHVFYFEIIPIFLVFVLFFYPRHRSIRLNRKERVIYMQAFHKVFVIPVLDKGDPLMGMKYNRFSFYMFGSRKQFALLMTGLVVEGNTPRLNF